MKITYAFKMRTSSGTPLLRVFVPVDNEVYFAATPTSTDSGVSVICCQFVRCNQINFKNSLMTETDISKYPELESECAHAVDSVRRKYTIKSLLDQSYPLIPAFPAPLYKSVQPLREFVGKFYQRVIQKDVVFQEHIQSTIIPDSVS